ncbi:hypothetical protein ABW19_dt0202742 [Dactylella cylindrospora]|nr:hypothetical protein ABW19_dt0202742 [Dactylella cylindrospora]
MGLPDVPAAMLLGSDENLDIIDLTDDFELETQIHRAKDRQLKETEDILEYPSGTVATPIDQISSPAFQSPVTPSPRTASSKGTTRNNTKRSTKKRNTSQFGGWRKGQNFEEPTVEVTVTKREKEKKLKEAERKEIGDRIQKLAAQVGWEQPKGHGERTTRKNAEAVPYKYKQERAASCTICCEKTPIFEVAKLRCKHQHCHSCLQQNFLMVINDPNSWPAKCCHPLDPVLASVVLSAEDFSRYLDVKKEKEQMSTTSCFRCRQLLQSINIIGGSQGFCPECDSITCVHCTKAMHEGACLLDPETEKLLQVAKGKKWSKCPRCSNMVERNTGCNSMVCRCGMNFCYRCGRQMSLCSSSGNCEQIEFQPNMWLQQAPHKPIHANATTLNQYRQRAHELEANQKEEQDRVKKENSEAQKQHEVVSEIVSLRAKLEKKKADKPGKHSESPKPEKGGPKTPVGLDGYRKAFPALMKAFEENKAAKEAPKDVPKETPKPPSLLDRYQRSFPALMKTFQDKGQEIISAVTVSEPPAQAPPVVQPLSSNGINLLNDDQSSTPLSLWGAFNEEDFQAFGNFVGFDNIFDSTPDSYFLF